MSSTADAINFKGEIAGSYKDASAATHSFLRTTNAVFTIFDPPGAIHSRARSINPKGLIAGFYYGADFIYHGYLRAADGTITTFDLPGSVLTEPFAINAGDEITGYYQNGGGTLHGFLRSATGVLTAPTMEAMSSKTFLVPATLSPSRQIRNIRFWGHTMTRTAFPTVF